MRALRICCFYHVISGNRIQVLRCGSKHLKSLVSFESPKKMLLILQIPVGYFKGEQVVLCNLGDSINTI